ncbi:MAG: NAD(+)/NADH kinase [Candidatus Cryptobacteroides sp.]
MKIAYLIKKNSLQQDPSIESLLATLRSAGMELYKLEGQLDPATELLLSFGGDGTFLTAASLACVQGVPVLGVNLGRLGFLSENKVEEVSRALISEDYSIEERAMLEVKVENPEFGDIYPYALNEVVVRRLGAGTLALNVSVDSEKLPTYWADGILLSTSSGSTAYSLSVGGPICRPDVDAFILSPIAPHNLNLRPLVLPSTSKLEIRAEDRKYAGLALSLDNRDLVVPSGTAISVSAAPFKLKKLVLGKSNFIQALRTKLLWGEDVRNIQ